MSAVTAFIGDIGLLHVLVDNRLWHLQSEQRPRTRRNVGKVFGLGRHGTNSPCSIVMRRKYGGILLYFPKFPPAHRCRQRADAECQASQ